MADMQVRFTGGPELADALQDFTYREMRGHVRTGSRYAMQPVREQAVQSAMRFDDPETPIEVYRNIAIRAKWDKQEEAQLTSVGVLGGARYRKKPTQEAPFYWRYRELGSEHQRAQPFLRPALDQNTDEVLSRFVSRIQRRIATTKSRGTR